MHRARVRHRLNAIAAFTVSLHGVLAQLDAVPDRAAPAIPSEASWRPAVLP